MYFEKLTNSFDTKEKNFTHVLIGKLLFFIHLIFSEFFLLF